MSVKFETFLSRASSYSSLSFKSSTQLTTKRLILLEDLPNILHLGTRETFHSALESFVHATPTCPLVIIVSDSGTRGEARDSAGGWQAGGSKDVAIDIRSVLPKSLLGGPYVTEIKYVFTSFSRSSFSLIL
jgi:cell cycle checkpoint protein